MDETSATSDSDPLNIRKHNKRSRSRRKGIVCEEEIAFFQVSQESFRDKSTQSFSQTVQNRHIYGTRETSSTTPNPIKSKRKHKQNSKHKYKQERKKKKSKEQLKKQQNKVLLDITTALGKQQQMTFRRTMRNASEKLRNSNDINQFETLVLNPWIVLFNTNKRRKYLSKLSAFIPPNFQSFYGKKLKEINRKRSSYIVNLCSETQETFLLSSSVDWRCSNCSIENISQSTQCDLCGTQRDEYNVIITDNPYTQRSIINVNGENLEKIPASHAMKLEQRLERLRHKLKRDWNIRQLHSVLSEPTEIALSEYAPIHMEQLSYFEIAPKKIKKYGVEIVNVIKEYLHENGLVSPFLKISQKAMEEKQDNVHRVHCVYCRILFADNVIVQHEKECVMRPKEVIVISDDEQKEDEDKKNAEDEEIDGDDVDMNGKEDEDKRENDDERDYFEGIDDAVFTQMIEEENERMNALKKENEEDGEIEDMELDTTGFVDDNALLQCLERTEQQIRVKTELENELKQKRAELSAVEMRENEIKQQRLRIQQQIHVLEEKLRSFNA